VGKKKRKLLSPKFAKWRKINGLDVDVKPTPAVEEKTEEVKIPEPEVVLEKQEPAVDIPAKETKTKPRRKTTTNKATITTRRKRTTKAKPTTTDI